MTIQFKHHADRQFSSVDGLSMPPERRPADAWSSVPCLILLGTPGMGKSFEFQHQHERLQKQGAITQLSPWRDWDQRKDIFDLLDDRESFFAALGDGQTVWWFLDALDEGRLKASDAFDQLSSGLRQLKRQGLLHHLKLRISCRAQDWRASECEKLARHLGDGAQLDGVLTLHLLPLDDSAVQQLSGEKLGAVASRDFLRAVDDKRLKKLTGHPLLLSLMLDQYQTDGGALKEDRTAIYARAAEKLAMESNEEYVEKRVWKYSSSDRLQLSRKIAVHYTFGGHASLYVPEEARGEIVGLDVTRAQLDSLLMTEALSTSLFTQNFGSGRDFMHRSFAEFLAADGLAEQMKGGLPLSRVKPFFPQEHGVIPGPLRETAAWLAGLDDAFRQWLIEIDPVCAAHGDVIRFRPADRLALIKRLAHGFGERDWQSEVDRMADLASAVPAVDLEALLDSARGTAARQMALELIQASQAATLASRVSAIVFNAAEDADLRCTAIDALVAIAPGQFLEELLALVDLPDAQDPDDEITGTVLGNLYPDHIGLDRVLQTLRPCKRAYTIGMFRKFWEIDFWEALPKDSASRCATMRALAKRLEIRDDSPDSWTLGNMLVRLMLAEMHEAEPDIDQLGPLLVGLGKHLSEADITDRTALSALVERIDSLPAFRSRLTQWRLGTWPEDQEFYPSRDLPLHDHFKTKHNFGDWLQCCYQYADRPGIGPNLFSELVDIANQSPGLCLYENIHQFCRDEPAYAEIWQRHLECPLDSPSAQSRRRNRQRTTAGLAERERAALSIRSSVDQIRAGNLYPIWTAIAYGGLDNYWCYAKQVTAERFGTEVADAVEVGLVKHWEQCADVDRLWPRTLTVPHWAIVLGMGYFEKHKDGEWASQVSDAQVQFLIWRAMERSEFCSRLLPILWTNFREPTWARLRESLLADAPERLDAVLHLWNVIGQTTLPPDVAEAISAVILETGLPRHPKIRCRVLELALEHRLEPLFNLAHATAVADWGTPGSEPDDVKAAMLSLATAWIHSPDESWPLVEAALSGEAHHDRAVDFLGAIQDIQKAMVYIEQWPTSVSLASYARLVPLLFPIIEIQDDDPEDNKVTPRRLFQHQRRSLINMLEEKGGEACIDWLASWKENPVFGPHRNWFASLYRHAIQRNADEKWDRPSCEAINDALFGISSLVRNPDDFAVLVCETIDRHLTPAFRSDASPAHSLWTGTKKDKTYAPVGEKLLQACVYSHLNLLLKGLPIVGAREPEVLNAKKPDVQIACVMPSGEVCKIPIEVKWATHGELWVAPQIQLLAKYMQDHDVRHGIYLVGWIDSEMHKVPPGPNGERPTSADELMQQLTAVVNHQLGSPGKSISVHVLDASMPGE